MTESDDFFAIATPRPGHGPPPKKGNLLRWPGLAVIHRVSQSLAVLLRHGCPTKEEQIALEEEIKDALRRSCWDCGRKDALVYVGKDWGERFCRDCFSTAHRSPLTADRRPPTAKTAKTAKRKRP